MMLWVNPGHICSINYKNQDMAVTLLWLIGPRSAAPLDLRQSSGKMTGAYKNPVLATLPGRSVI
jgi:hypothetical protein